MSNKITRGLTTAFRLLLGLGFFGLSLLNLLGKMPQPKDPLPQGAMDFSMALVNSGYMMPLILWNQLIVGALLLANRFVPLALALIAPFMLNSVLFHIYLERTGLPMSLVFAGMVLYLAWAYRNAYRPMLAAKVVPES